MLRCCLISFGIGFAGLAQAHSSPLARSCQSRGAPTHQTGKFIIQTTNSRPVQQALSQLRDKYGLTLDYEEGATSDPRRISGTGNQRRWIGGRYTIKLREPRSPDFAASRRMIAEVLSQFSASGAQHFTTILGANHRITVTPSNASKRILDTPIVISVADRSVDETIEAILAAVSQQIGRPFEIGGIADNGTAETHVTLGSATPIPARLLLAQVLDAVPFRRSWDQNWEPGTDTYIIAIQSADKMETTPAGVVCPVK